MFVVLDGDGVRILEYSEGVGKRYAVFLEIQPFLVFVPRKNSLIYAQMYVRVKRPFRSGERCKSATAKPYAEFAGSLLFLTEFRYKVAVFAHRDIPCEQ